MADQKMARGKNTGAGKQSADKKTAGTKKKGTGAAGAKSTVPRTGKKAGTGQKNTGNARQVDPEERLSDSMKEEIVLAVTLLVSLLFFLSYINLCGTVGTWLNTLTFGLFGIFGYFFPFLLFFGVAFGLSNRKNRIARRKLWCTVAFFVCLAALVELLGSYDPELKWAGYFTASAKTKSGGGILGGTLVKLLCPLFDVVATAVILVVLMLICLMLVTGKEIFAYVRNMADGVVQNRRREEWRQDVYQEGQEAYDEEPYLPQPQQPRIITFPKKEGVDAGKGKTEHATFPKEEPIRFVDALKARGKKGAKGGDMPPATEKEAAPIPPQSPPQLPPMQPVQEITITGDYQKEEVSQKPPVSYYEEELERKFGGAKENAAPVDTIPVERNFYDVNVSKDGATVKGKNVILIHKALYGDEEPLIPPMAPLSEKEPEKAEETKEEVLPAQDNTTVVEQDGEDGFVVSADMIFANAGIDPSAVELAKRDEPSGDADEKENAIPMEAAYPEEGGTVLAQGDPIFWPDMSVEEEPVPSGPALFKETSADPLEEQMFDDMGSTVPDNTAMPAAPGQGRAADAAALKTSGASAASAPQETILPANTILMPTVVPEKEYEFPPIDLLAQPVKGKGANERELKETAAKLQSTLQSFGVRVAITNISCGPTVTQYELQPEQGVKVNQITKLSDDIKLNLAATDIRIEAPIPGKAAIGIEVPNKENTPVILRELIESEEFKKHKSRLAFAVGKNISGQIVVSDIAKMPHMLIAGATGSGKSVCINTIIMSILYKADPKDVKLIMVDPKVVELSVYNGIPHLLIPVVTDPKKASAALNWAVAEMTDRYQKFAALSVRDLNGYNEKVKGFDEPNPAFPPMPQIVIIVDELADLMMVASANEVEDAICRLAQMARAAGIHLIIATQRPSVNVITGVIKANVPSRVAFAVTSAVDSRTILDGVGAERLLGKGDMLFFPSGYPKPVRIQGAFVSDAEVSAVVDFLKEQAEGANNYNEEVNQRIMTATGGGDGGAAGGGDGNDDYFAEAGKFIIEKQKASIGMLQRVYKVGFNRAARIMDQLTAAGVVGPEEGTKPRKILMTMAEFEEYLRGGT